MKISNNCSKKIIHAIWIYIALANLFDNLCFAQIVDTTKVVEIVIIDFLYVSEGFPTAKQLERDILIPGIDRALNLVQAHDFKFNVKRVAKGSLNYYIQREALKSASITTYDIAIWGHVTPYKELGSYDLQMMVFTNPSKLDQCLFYYELEIRDGRIRRWNNIQCDLPESGIALIPATLCYKLISFLDKNRTSSAFAQSVIDKSIKQRILPLIGSLPTDEVIVWHPSQNCDADKLIGTIHFELDEGDELVLSVHMSLFNTLSKNLSKNIAYNWPIKDNRKLSAKKHTDWWLIAGGAAIAAGVLQFYTLAGSPPTAPPPPFGKVRIEINQIQK